MKKIILWLDKHLEESIMLVLLSGIVVIMGVQVFMRYVLKNSLAWPEELTRYLFIWFVFLGMGYGIRYDIHIRVDLLEVICPQMKKLLYVIQDLLFLGFCIFMIRPSINGVMMMVRTGQTSAAMNLPIYYVYISLLAGFILSIFRFIQKYIFIFMKKGSFEEAKA